MFGGYVNMSYLCGKFNIGIKYGRGEKESI